MTLWRRSKLADDTDEFGVFLLSYNPIKDVVVAACIYYFIGVFLKHELLGVASILAAFALGGPHPTRFPTRRLL